MRKKITWLIFSAWSTLALAGMSNWTIDVRPFSAAWLGDVRPSYKQKEIMMKSDVVISLFIKNVKAYHKIHSICRVNFGSYCYEQLNNGYVFIVSSSIERSLSSLHHHNEIRYRQISSRFFLIGLNGYTSLCQAARSDHTSIVQSLLVARI